jgi:hypothetical protein
MVATPGSIYSAKHTFSIWRIPNVLLEARGSYLGEPDVLVSRLNWTRTLLAMVIVVGMTVYYSGLSHLATVTHDKNGTPVVTVGNGTPEAHWFTSVLVTITIAAFTLPLISLIIVLFARSGARLRTLRQLCVPLIAALSFFGIVAIGPLLIEGAQWVTALAGSSILMKIASYLFSVFVGVLALAWIAKACYFAATGLFRADDGHPLLGPIAAPLIATLSALFMRISGVGNGLTGVPDDVGVVTEIGGPISILLVSLTTLLHLRRRYAGWPFRDGPVRHS